MKARKNYTQVARTFRCGTCRLVFASLEEQRVHCQDAFHAFNMKRKINNLAAVSFEDFERLRAIVESRKAEELDKEEKRLNGAKQSAPYREEVREPYRFEPAKSFFDDHMSTSTNANVRYMQENFGFFIPCKESLTDAEGLLRSLSLELADGGCLWCEKRFPSVSAAQRHMVDASHCKFAFSKDHYARYYSLPEGAETPKVTPAQNGLELVLPSGETIGHRSMVQYYKQHHRGDVSKLHKSRKNALAKGTKINGPQLPGTKSKRTKRDWHIVRANNKQLHFRGRDGEEGSKAK